MALPLPSICLPFPQWPLMSSYNSPLGLPSPWTQWSDSWSQPDFLFNAVPAVSFQGDCPWGECKGDSGADPLASECFCCWFRCKDDAFLGLRLVQAALSPSLHWPAHAAQLPALLSRASCSSACQGVGCRPGSLSEPSGAALALLRPFWSV